MKDVFTVSDVLEEIQSDYAVGVKAERTDDRVTFEAWKSQPASDEAEAE